MRQETKNPEGIDKIRGKERKILAVERWEDGRMCYCCLMHTYQEDFCQGLCRV